MNRVLSFPEDSSATIILEATPVFLATCFLPIRLALSMSVICTYSRPTKRIKSYSAFKNCGPASKFGHFWRFSE